MMACKHCDGLQALMMQEHSLHTSQTESNCPVLESVRVCCMTVAACCGCMLWCRLCPGSTDCLQALCKLLVWLSSVPYFVAELSSIFPAQAPYVAELAPFQQGIWNRAQPHKELEQGIWNRAQPHKSLSREYGTELSHTRRNMEPSSATQGA